jgi:NAD(P)-dependent dehydrogenase (short-subunit alcohol dehydrogenase family)
MNVENARHAFITGGASGIGLAIAEALAARGVRVTIADVNREGLDTVLAANAGTMRGTYLDVRDRAGWAAAKAEAEAAFGPVDILVNNAGIASIGFEIADMDPEAFDRVVAVDLTGVFNGVSAFAADMRARRHGHIVNTASMAGISSPRTQVGGSYAAAKFGVVGLTETLREELAPHGVGVSVLCPGQVSTGIVENSAKFGGEVKRLPPPGMKMGGGEAAEVASLVLKAIEGNEPYVITHGQGWWPGVERRHLEIREAFAGMRDEAG